MNDRKPDPTCVICPNCTHQFRAIPIDVQDALRAKGGVPVGFKLVPLEPTPEMWDAAETAHIMSDSESGAAIPHNFPTDRINGLVVAYRAMIAASPDAATDVPGLPTDEVK